MAVTTNTKEDQYYSFGQEDMRIISRKPLPWKACIPAPFLLHLGALIVNCLTVSTKGQGTWGHVIAKAQRLLLSLLCAPPHLLRGVDGGDGTGGVTGEARAHPGAAWAVEVVDGGAVAQAGDGAGNKVLEQ